MAVAGLSYYCIGYCSQYKALVHSDVQCNIFESWFRGALFSYCAHACLSLLFLACLLLRKNKKLLIPCMLLFFMTGISPLAIPSTVNYDFVMLLCFLSYGLWVGRKHRLLPLTYGFAVVLGFLFSIVAPTRFEPNLNTPLQQTNTDMRLVAEAVRSYTKTETELPAYTTNPAERLLFDSSSSMPTFRRFEPGAPDSLTTPIAHISRLPKDPFHMDDEFRTFSYWHDAKGKWIIISAGPDCEFDLTINTIQSILGSAEPAAQLLPFSYDPTNGILSKGDITRTD